MGAGRRVTWGWEKGVEAGNQWGGWKEYFGEKVDAIKMVGEGGWEMEDSTPCPCDPSLYI